MRKITAVGLMALSFTAAASAAAAPAALASPAQIVRAGAVPSDGGSGAATRAGENLGKLITSWGEALLFAVAGCMLIGSLRERQVGNALTIFGLAMLAGSFLFAPDSMGNFVIAAANQLFG